MFLVVSRDSSTDRHQKGKRRLSTFTLSDKSKRKNKFNQKSQNGPLRKKIDLMSISWPSDSIFCESMQQTSVFRPREPTKMIEINIFWTNSKWSLAKVFWTLSIMNPLMTSRAWFIPKLFENSDIRCRPNI